MIHILGNDNSIFQNFLAEIRDQNIQSDSMRFRLNLERISEIFAYEISKTLTYKPTKITTPLGISDMKILKDKILIASIMRAGLPMHNGLLRFFDTADNAFISAYRKYTVDGKFTINFEYISSPSTKDKILLIVDPMLATGRSMEIAYNALVTKGKPKYVHIISLIASTQGLDHVKANLGDKNISIWLGAVDNELTSKSFIVPGCGDVGDLAYGQKNP